MVARAAVSSPGIWSVLGGLGFAVSPRRRLVSAPPPRSIIVTDRGRRSGVCRLPAAKFDRRGEREAFDRGERRPCNLNRGESAKIPKRVATNAHIKSKSLTQRGTAINFHALGNSSRGRRTFPASKRRVRRWLARLLRRPATTSTTARLAFGLSLKQCRRTKPTRLVWRLDKFGGSDYFVIPSVLVEHRHGYRSDI
jgi:hypothetical protein